MKTTRKGIKENKKMERIENKRIQGKEQRRKGKRESTRNRKQKSTKTWENTKKIIRKRKTRK